MAIITGVNVYGVLVSDRERENVGYLLHTDCLEELRTLLTDAGASPMRLVEMGPGTTDASETCNKCGKDFR